MMIKLPGKFTSLIKHQQGFPALPFIYQSVPQMDRRAETVPTPLFIQGGARQIVNVSGSVVHDHAHHCYLKAAPGEAWMFCVRLGHVVLC